MIESCNVNFISFSNMKIRRNITVLHNYHVSCRGLSAQITLTVNGIDYIVIAVNRFIIAI